MNAQFVTAGRLFALNIPPPSSAELLMKMQFVTVGLLSMFNIPPPHLPPTKMGQAFGLPSVTVKPSRTVPGPSPVTHLTTVVSRPVASIVVTSAPSELRSAIALPRKSIVSK